MIKTVVEKIVEAVAHIGAGTASAGFAYEPKKPNKLKK